MKTKEQLYQDALELTKSIMANPATIEDGLDVTSVLIESYNALVDFDKYVDNFKRDIVQNNNK